MKRLTPKQKVLRMWPNDTGRRPIRKCNGLRYRITIDDIGQLRAEPFGNRGADAINNGGPVVKVTENDIAENFIAA